MNALSDCIYWETNTLGDCAGRVEAVPVSKDGVSTPVLVCETCRNRKPASGEDRDRDNQEAGDPMSDDPDFLEQLLADATEESIATEIKEVKITLKLMCLRAKILWPTAECIVLDDSDQGTWATVADVRDADGNTLLPEGYWDDGDTYASHLYDNKVDVWKKYLQEGSWGGRSNPGVGVLIIEKVLEDLEEL